MVDGLVASLVDGAKLPVRRQAREIVACLVQMLASDISKPSADNTPRSQRREAWSLRLAKSTRQDNWDLDYWDDTLSVAGMVEARA
jgi:hypothetical protein